MSDIKDKLIEIAKEIIINNADCSEISDDIITLDEFGYDHACEEVADSIIEKLPEILADSEWVRLPCKVGDTICKYSNDLSTVWCEKIKKISINENYFTIYAKGFRPIKSSEFEIKKLGNESFIDIDCIYIATKTEAEEKLAKIKEK